MRKIINQLIGLFLLITVFLAALPTQARNASGDILPPRPTLTPTPQATAVSAPTAAPDRQTAVASIRLAADGDTTGWQTAVEWQDSNRNWHLVAGWQAPFNQYNQVVWAVAQSDYGKGPFRWVIFRNGETIDDSLEFYLPLTTNKIVSRHITLP